MPDFRPQNFIPKIRNLFVSSTKSNTLQETTNLLDKIRQLSSGGWKSKFVSDIYGEQRLYPHEEMQVCDKAYKYNAFLQEAVNARARFLIGGKIEAVSDDPKTMRYLNEQLNKTGLTKIFHQMGVDIYTVGNGYLERIRSNGQIVAYQYVPHPERIYHALDKSGFVDYYVQEIPENMLSTSFTTITYYGDKPKNIKGIKIEKNKIAHFYIGVAEIPTYGRSPVASTVNDVEILLEIERAMAIIARYKAVPKKLIQTEEPATPKGLQLLINQLNNLSDEDNPVVSQKLKVDDLSYSGKEINFEPIAEYLKKKITVSLVPSFLIHGDTTNYAVSRDQRASFMLQNNADREIISQQLKKELRVMAKSQGVTLSDFDIEFGDFDLGQNEDNRMSAIQLFQTGLIKLNEAREIIGMEEDKEIGDLYSHELIGGSSLFGTQDDDGTTESVRTAQGKYLKNIKG